MKLLFSITLVIISFFSMEDYQTEVTKPLYKCQDCIKPFELDGSTLDNSYRMKKEFADVLNENTRANDNILTSESYEDVYDFIHRHFEFELELEQKLVLSFRTRRSPKERPGTLVYHGFSFLTEPEVTFYKLILSKKGSDHYSYYLVDRDRMANLGFELDTSSNRYELGLSADIVDPITDEKVTAVIDEFMYTANIAHHFQLDFLVGRKKVSSDHVAEMETRFFMKKMPH